MSRTPDVRFNLRTTCPQFFHMRGFLAFICGFFAFLVIGKKSRIKFAKTEETAYKDGQDQAGQLGFTFKMFSSTQRADGPLQVRRSGGCRCSG